MRRGLPIAVVLALATAWTVIAGPVARAQPVVPEFGAARDLTVIGTEADGLDVPRDLAFHPERAGELWTVNRATDGTVIYFDAGTESQRVEARVDSLAYHFMEEVSSIAFGDANTFATCQESRNTYNDRSPPNDFMGPTLWPADLDIYAKVNQLYAAEEWELSPFSVDGSDALSNMICRLPGGDRPLQARLGSHIDMNHESPLCMGIAHDEANVYWIVDGLHGNIIEYDFVEDHGPGNDDHSDARLRRFTEATFTRVPDVPGHAVLDRQSEWLYYADTGAGVVKRLNTGDGRRARNLRYTDEPIASFQEWRDAEVEVFVSGLERPSGVALHAGRLFVSDNATGAVHAYDLNSGDLLGTLQTDAESLMGIEIGPEGKLWYVDAAANELVRVDPEAIEVPTDQPTEVPPTETESPTETQAPPSPSATLLPPTAEEPTREPPTATEPTSTEPTGGDSIRLMIPLVFARG